MDTPITHSQDTQKDIALPPREDTPEVVTFHDENEHPTIIPPKVHHQQTQDPGATVQDIDEEESDAQAETPSPRQRRITWTLGNFLLVAGIYLLCYVGGLYANAAYEQYAARGDNNLVPQAIEVPLPSAPNAFIVPNLNRTGEDRRASQPIQEKQAVHSLVKRLLIPKIGIDSKVIPVGWTIVEENGQQLAVWEVAKYAVGHHYGSANPGENSNVVLAGHVGGEAPVFKDLIELEAGDQITLVSEEQQYLYEVKEKLLVQEVGVPQEIRLENARYIEPTSQELVTLITCWPPAGPNKFDQRIIVRASPYGSDLANARSSEMSNWMAR